MKPPEKPLAYVILGTPGSGRREVLADLIADGLAAGERAVTLLSVNESPSAFDPQLGTVVRWEWQDNAIHADLPESAEAAESTSSESTPETRYFFVADGTRDPVDQIEALKPWFDTLDVEFARVITIVDCQLASKHTALMPWFEACIHFSDVVLLGRRDGVLNKWMSDFQGKFKDLHIPALFEFIKDGRVKNPALILEPQARRVSHVFDDDVEWVLAKGMTENEDLADGEEEEVEMEPETDPYFERRQNGRRVHELPDIRNYLPPASTPA